MKLTSEQLIENFKYLIKRADHVIIQLRELSKDGRYTHDCNSKILLIDSWKRITEYEIKYKKDSLISSVYTYEQYIITAEDYLIKIAQGMLK